MSPIIIATTAFIIIVLAIYSLGIPAGMWPSPRELALFKREPANSIDPEEAVDLACPDIHGYECADDDCACECHDDESDEFPEDREYLTTTPGTQVTFRSDGTVEFTGPGNYYHVEKAVEVDLITQMTEFDWVEYRDTLREEMRVKYPRLYRDDWYTQARATFSAWSVDMYTYMADTRKECGLAT